MAERFQRCVALCAFAGWVTVASAGCFGGSNTETPQSQAPTTPAATVSPVAASATPQPTPDASAADATANQHYQDAVNRASSAFNISQSARSQDDWQLVASRWQQAIDLLEQIPASSSNHTQVQQKIAEYQRNLAYAQQQANRTVESAPSDAVVIIESQDRGSSSVVPPVDLPGDTSGRVYRAPIISRAGGTPVINVNFNNGQVFPMIVDTGASGTLITPQMANLLAVRPVGQTSVATASASNVAFSVGYVDSIEVDGAIARNVLVAVSGPDLGIGLLGHDFFGDFDVTIGEDYVEFRER
jgi:predicted aspartyl protease